MEKKIFLFAILGTFLFSSTFTQIEKNDWLLGGTLGINNTSNSPNGNSTSNAILRLILNMLWEKILL